MVNKDLEKKLINLIKDKAKMSDEQINIMIKETMEEYNNLLDFSGALVIIAKNYDIDLSPFDGTNDSGKDVKFTSVKDIKGDSKDINIVGLISEILPLKSYKKKDNSDGFYFKFEVQEKTDTIPVIAWEPLHNLLDLPDFKIGSIVKILSAYAKKGLKDQIELHLSKNSQVELEPSEVDNKLLPTEFVDLAFTELNSINSPQKDLNIRVRVKSIFPIKNYNKPDGSESQFMKIILADSSGEKPMVIFDEKVNDFKQINPNDIITVSKIYSKRNKIAPDLIELIPSANSLVTVVVPSTEVVPVPSNYAPIVPIDEFKKQPAKGSVKGTLVGKEPLKVIQSKNGPLNLVKIKIMDDSGQISINFWGDDVSVLDSINEGAEIIIYDLYGKTNTYTKEIEGNYSRSSRVVQSNK